MLNKAQLLLQSVGFLVFALWVSVDLVAFAQSPDSDAPLLPEEAARTMVVPEGFSVSLFAGEPDVRQPIGFCIDDRGRLWVAEAYNYPIHGTKPGDRILIFEDTDGDGKFDNRKVFYDQLNYVTGIEVGFGGAWVMSPPNFYFIPDRNGDDIPDSKPEVLLDGFGNHANSHNLANGFAWGPDGWLYGTHGRTNWSRIGKPGTSDDQREQFDGGVYRYHPVRHEWEPYADGTTNPWGIDWNDFGEGFVCNCVTPHLFHVIQGAHYEPWRNRPSSQYAYARIDTIADHLHFVGKQNVRDGLGSHEEDAAGGGHAHCGTMIYLGDNWPEQYRNSVFMNNIHGKRINNDLLKSSGSGYVASHAPDILRSRDPWHMGVTLQYGPDGGVFVLDWSDTGECHSVRNTQRETGRIFKIVYGQPSSNKIDLGQVNSDELVNLHKHRNDWFVRHARRLLQERAAQGADMTDAKRSLREILNASAEVPLKLRAFWTLHALNDLKQDFLLQQLKSSSEHIRAWSVRFLCEDRNPSEQALERLAQIAAIDTSPVVRLYLASALQRLALHKRWSILEPLLRRPVDSLDANLPLMYWYAVEPLFDAGRKPFIAFTSNCKIPLVREHIARRAASSKESIECLAELIQVLRSSDDSELHSDVLRGTLTGLEGRRNVVMPAGWSETWDRLKTSKLIEVRQLSLELALIFNDPSAVDLLRTQAEDKQNTDQERNRAIQALVNKKFPQTADLLFRLLEDPVVSHAAIRGLAEFDHPETAETLIVRFGKYDLAGQQDILQTLASKVIWAGDLLQAMESGQIPRKSVTAYTVRQLQNLGDAQLDSRVKGIWGEIRTSTADKSKQIADAKKRLTPDAIRSADVGNGRLLFQKHCGNCHRLFDSGGTIGPDLTGSQRTNISYLLENLIDPSATVSKDFQMELIVTSTDRVVTGLVVAENEVSVTIQTVNEKIVVPKDEIENRKLSQVSLMPEGILQPLTFAQVRDLIAYLTNSSQVKMPVDRAP